MKIIDILKDDKLSLSFEVFPPKKETSYENVRRATEEIAAMNPAFMSVTYGAGGGTSNYTIDIARNSFISHNRHTHSQNHGCCHGSDQNFLQHRVTSCL